MDQSKAFSIDRIYFSINRKSHREFFKTFSFSRVKHFFKLFQSYSLSLRSVKDSKLNFLLLSLKLFARFLSSKASKTLLPLLFHLFSCFMHFGEISNLWKFGDFDDFNLFFLNLSMGFCYRMILTWSLWFNLINLMNWENLIFLGLETTRIGDFVQLSINWWNWLICLIGLIIIFYYLTCVMINWSICWVFWKWVFKIWCFWYKLYAQDNFVVLKCNWTYSHCIRACIMCRYCSCII